MLWYVAIMQYKFKLILFKTAMLSDLVFGISPIEINIKINIRISIIKK